MAPDRHETRNVITLRTGSKIALLVALPFLGYALYNYITPLWVPSSNGVFGCGSAHNPPTSGWAKGACQGVPDAALYRAMISAGLGVILAALGVFLFGIDRKEQVRPIRDLDGYDRYDDEDDEPRGRHGRSADAGASDEDGNASRVAEPAARRSSGRRSYEEPGSRSERRRYADEDDDEDGNNLR
ncbi:hypothetical protein [Calidifontibacter terrae]